MHYDPNVPTAGAAYTRAKALETWGSHPDDDWDANMQPEGVVNRTRIIHDESVKESRHLPFTVGPQNIHFPDPIKIARHKAKIPVHPAGQTKHIDHDKSRPDSQNQLYTTLKWTQGTKGQKLIQDHELPMT